MQRSWLALPDRLLRPARPDLARCLEARERHRAEGALVAERRAAALARCEARIEAARAAVFANQDGVVTKTMTELEREWRCLARPDRDGRVMELWASIAPPEWIDQKRWRHAEEHEQLDVATVLAADHRGISAVEAVLQDLRASFSVHGVAVGAEVRFRAFERDLDPTTELLSPVLRLAKDVLAVRHEATYVLERAARLRLSVLRAVRERFPERPLFAESVAGVAHGDFVLGAAGLFGASPTACLRRLWEWGYGVSQIGARGVTVEIPLL